MTWTLPIGAQVTPAGVRFRVWAPNARRVEVVLFEDNAASARHPLKPEDETGFWSYEVDGIGAGTCYAYSLDGDDPRPDPASRWQPDGVHGPSAVVDPSAFGWTDQQWSGIGRDDLIIYEVHVGTATPEGTFDALIAKLPYFRELGVTALEIMPVADFPGCRNWGYDGVNLYAPARCYGGPEGFRRLVDAAHAHGLAIILDVVYNHFGPDGNYLRLFSQDYFTDRHHTPWGDALNLDGPNSGPVRQYLIDNAVYWALEYHVDGLRLDAIHALIDDGPRHMLQDLIAAVHQQLPADRKFVITAEDERNEARLGLPQAEGGYGFDAIWADDFHHQVRVLLTGERGGYYGDYPGTIEDLVKTIDEGWYYQGQFSPSLKRKRGTSPHELQPAQFIYCIQNHDQIGNRPIGDRLNHAVSPEAYRAASALLLLVPETPLLFQGQEWAASSPFQFFTDHNEELGKLVTEGRHKEFAYFLTETGVEVPDPQDVDTFERSKLRWDEIEQPQHSGVLALYRDLLALRRSHPALRRNDRGGLHVSTLGERALLVRRNGADSQQTLMIVVNLGDACDLELPRADLQATAYNLLLDTNNARYGGGSTGLIFDQERRPLRISMSGPGVVVLEARNDHSADR